MLSVSQQGIKCAGGKFLTVPSGRVHSMFNFPGNSLIFPCPGLMPLCLVFAGLSRIQPITLIFSGADFLA